MVNNLNLGIFFGFFKPEVGNLEVDFFIKLTSYQTILGLVHLYLNPIEDI